MIPYVTFHILREYLGHEDTDKDPAAVEALTWEASRQLDRWCYRTFYPRRATLYLDHPPRRVLKLPEDLLEVETLKTQNGDTTIDAADFFLLCGDRYDLTPYDRIELRTGAAAVFSYSTTPQRANELTGIWGFHNRYARAWAASGDSVQDAAGIDDSVTTITVDDLTESNPAGRAPRFQEGQLLKIGTEYLLLLGIEEAANELSVMRAANGTEAAAHAKDAAIYVYDPGFEVVRAAKELARYLYLRDQATETEVVSFPQTGAALIPKGVPTRVRNFVKAYRRWN